jgi:hypothetical protein
MKSLIFSMDIQTYVSYINIYSIHVYNAFSYEQKYYRFQYMKTHYCLVWPLGIKALTHNSKKLRNIFILETPKQTTVKIAMSS